ncbi:MAG: cell division protein FtsA [Leptonema sp. (in: bacteria)]
MRQIISSIDLGSFSIKVLIGQIINSKIEIIGIGSSESRGVKEGEILNIEQLSKSLSYAIREAENMSGIKISSAIVNLSNKYVRGENSKGICVITNEERMITQNDVNRAVENAKDIHIPSEYQLLHVLSREYIVDKKTNVSDPIGMTGFRLEADVHVVMAPKVQINTIFKIFQKMEIEIEHIILNSIASSEAILKESERNSGCIVIDFGFGVSDVCIYIDGGIYHTFSLPLGASYLTSDLEYAFKIPFEIAEFIKRRDGVASVEDVDPTQRIELPHIMGSSKKIIYLKDLVNVLESRIEEIFGIIYKIIRKKVDKNLLSGGVILTGGGSLLTGIAKVVEKIFGLPSRIGKPIGIEGLFNEVHSPEFSTSVGMIKFFSKQIRDDFKEIENYERYPIKKEKKILNKLKNWIENI